jgi:uncharacterized protein with PIN domain
VPLGWVKMLLHGR